MKPLVDEEVLISRAKNGDRKAISSLYKVYVQPIYKYISYRVETDSIAEDLTADVFLKMINNLSSFTYTGKPLGAWLFRIASNCVKDHYRENKHAVQPLTENNIVKHTELIEDIVEEEERMLLRTAIMTLSEDYQNVLIMRFMEDLSYTDVANVMERSVEAVRVLQHRALKAFGKTLATNTNEDILARGNNDE